MGFTGSWVLLFLCSSCAAYNDSDLVVFSMRVLGLGSQFGMKIDCLLLVLNLSAYCCLTALALNYVVAAAMSYHCHCHCYAPSACSVIVFAQHHHATSIAKLSIGMVY
jgi:hypothetical protein